MTIEPSPELEEVVRRFFDSMNGRDMATVGGTRFEGRLGNGTIVPGRWTGVLHLEQGYWRFVQWHTSIAVTNEEALGVELTTSIETIAASVREDRPDLSSVAREGTVTIVFSDMENSTEMAVRLGDAGWADLIRDHNKTVADLVADHHGTVVSFLGDGHMMAFPSARRALDCAVTLERALLNAPVRLRVGLHSGEPVREADEFYGQAVIMAARIAAEARGGEILASELVHALTSPAGSFEFGQPRASELKGLPGTHLMYPVLWS